MAINTCKINPFLDYLPYANCVVKKVLRLKKGMANLNMKMIRKMLKCNVNIVNIWLWAAPVRPSHSFLTADQCAERGLPLIAVNVCVCKHCCVLYIEYKPRWRCSTRTSGDIKISPSLRRFALGGVRHPLATAAPRKSPRTDLAQVASSGLLSFSPHLCSKRNWLAGLR